MKKKKIDIDIIMGIYNCESYLSECIDSILNQTISNWRLIICDDGSSDNSYKLAVDYSNKYKDKIVVLKNEKNMGLNYTLNKCLNYSTAKYIARMDGDDYSHSDRLKKEYEFLESHSDYAFVSTNAVLFDESGDWGQTNYVPNPSNMDFLSISPFCHAAVMIRRDAIMSVGGYTIDKRLLRVEDYHLWFKLYSAGLTGYNIQENLYFIRDNREACLRRNWNNRKNEYYVRKIGFRMLNIPWYYRFYVYRPIVLGLIPNSLYVFLHKKRLKK